MKIKSTRKLTCLAAIFVFLACTLPLHATSAADLVAEAQTLEQADPTPASEVSSGGTYYSAALINKAGAAGLLPYPTSLNFPAWPLGGNVWLLDDLSTSASAAPAGLRAMDDSGPPIPHIGSGGGTNTLEPGYGLPAFTTNELWLQILSATNDTANLVIHPPWDNAGDAYDLLYTTNLSPPVNWSWTLRTAAAVWSNDD
jgi:hypothetical protein